MRVSRIWRSRGGFVCGGKAVCGSVFSGKCHADDCALPDGTKISPFYVNDVPDFVVVVAVTVDGDFVFVRQYRHGTRQILLELPAGCMEPTDSDPGAIRQEPFRSWQTMDSRQSALSIRV